MTKARINILSLLHVAFQHVSRYGDKRVFLERYRYINTWRVKFNQEGDNASNGKSKIQAKYRNQLIVPNIPRNKAPSVMVLALAQKMKKA